MMSDDGPVDVLKAIGNAFYTLAQRHIRAMPYTPGFNGTAERLIQSLWRECAKAMSFQNSEQRTTCWLTTCQSITASGSTRLSVGAYLSCSALICSSDKPEIYNT
jgi:hypothetical protein